MNRVQYSSYWLDRDIFDADLDDKDVGEKTDLGRIIRLASIRRAVANFVSIVAGKNLPVQFSSGQNSYTDGENIVIAAEENPEKFDSMVGLALHEASHVLLSDFSFVKKLSEIRCTLAASGVPSHITTGMSLVRRADVFRDILSDDLAALLPETPPGWDNRPAGMAYDEYYNLPYFGMALQLLDDLKFLMNILEDRRIDAHIFNTASGYRPYYAALYNKTFFTTEIGRNLRFNPEWRELTIENYLNRILFQFHPAASPQALPGLEVIYKMVDYSTIDRVAPSNDPTTTVKNQVVPAWQILWTYDSTPVLWKEACKIYAYILKFVQLGQLQMPGNQPKPGKGGKSSMEQRLSETPMDMLPNLDLPQESFVPSPVEKDQKGKGKNAKEVEGKYNAKKAEKDVRTAKVSLNGTDKKKKLQKNEIAQVDAVEKADGKLVDITGEGIPYGKCLVLRRLNNELFDTRQDWFIFKSSWRSQYQDAEREKYIAAGKRMGQILLHRLQVRNDPLMTKQTRLEHGHLDRHLLAQLGMDIESVFQQTRTDIHKPAMLHLTLDASGSMSGIKWGKVVTVAVALAYLSTKMRNVDTVISIRGGTGIPIVAVVFDSRRDQFSRFLKFMRLIQPNGATPEGLCFKATMDLILECADTHDVYFINFSDGQPTFSYAQDTVLGKKAKRRRYNYNAVDGVHYVGETAIKHTRAMMQMMRGRGVKILSYFITDYPSDGYIKDFRRMYGEDAVSVNVANVTEVLRTLNSRLIVRGG